MRRVKDTLKVYAKDGDNLPLATAAPILGSSFRHGATETYARIAMKAQAQSRATLETLAKLHQPREQTVRHVHVNDGGQAVIADQLHHHGGAAKCGSKQTIPCNRTGWHERRAA